MNSTYQELMSHVRAARGLEPVDLLLQHCRLINVCSGEVHAADIAVHGEVGSKKRTQKLVFKKRSP